jgi:membrane-associated protease RseP (regulator of RpoE activity)
MVKISSVRLLTIMLAAMTLGVVPALAEEWKSSDDEGGAFIGVYPENLDKDRREALEFKGDGILVEDVVAEGPAKEAGIKPGDIITKIDKESVTDTDDFRKIISKHDVGDKVNITLMRGSDEKEFTVKLAKRPHEMFSFNMPNFHFNSGSSGDDEEEDSGRGFLGVQSETVEGDLATYFGVKAGALVKEVNEDSPASKAGIMAGDVITQVGDAEVRSSETLRKAVRKHNPGDKVDVKLMRKGVEQTVATTLGEVTSFNEMDSEGSGRKIIIKKNHEFKIDMDELHDAIREALKDMNVHINDGREELKKDIEDLKQQMQELRQQMNEKKADKKEEKKK